jgi:xylulokinase
VILTVDLGTSVTKVVLWGDDGPVASGRCPVDTVYSANGRVEQDPAHWWETLVTACAACAAAVPSDASLRAVRAISFSAARQTFVPVAGDGSALGPAMVWSDRRATREAAVLAERTAIGASHRPRSHRAGVRPDAASVAAKVAWLGTEEPERLRAARWLLAPRDLLMWRLTGTVATDWTLASATGLYTTPDDGHGDTGDGGRALHLDTALVDALPEGVADKLPEPLPSDAVVGALLPRAAQELDLPAGIPVVAGAGDRACEVIGAGATPGRPMVSWGTTANVSIPIADLPESESESESQSGSGSGSQSGSGSGSRPEALIVTLGACGGWLLEGGLAAAGSLAEWLTRLTGIDLVTMAHHAAMSPPGANGVVVLPWFGGARAPWWRDSARGAIVGLGLDHRLGDVGRAVVEAVAWDVQRCLESAGTHQPFSGLVLGGGGATVALWTEILTAVTGLPATRRRSGEAASAGAAILGARAIGAEVNLDRLDPVEAEIQPDPGAVSAYRAYRPAVDAAADAVLALDLRADRVHTPTP